MHLSKYAWLYNIFMLMNYCIIDNMEHDFYDILAADALKVLLPKEIFRIGHVCSHKKILISVNWELPYGYT